MFKRLLSYLLLSGVFALGLQSCYYDNEEFLYPQSAPCDTINVTYSGMVAPLLSNQCNSCHGGASPAGGVTTDNYSDLKILVDNGRFRGSVNHEDGYSKMPKDKPKLSECDLKKIDTWISNGALND